MTENEKSSLWTFKQAAAPTQPQPQAQKPKPSAITEQYQCSEIDEIESRNRNLPICRHGRTYCQNAYDAEIVKLCPTKTFYERY
jgi:hypothetical protein